MAEHDQAEVPSEVKDSPHFARLRQRADALEAELAAAQTQIGDLRGVLVRNAVELAGFQPNAETGEFDPLVGLLVKEFTTSLTDETLPTKDAFAALAQQYNVPAPNTPAPGTETAQPSLAEQLAAAQGGGDQLSRIGHAPQPEASLDERIAAAEASGDVNASLALKAQKLRAIAS